MAARVPLAGLPAVDGRSGLEWQTIESALPVEVVVNMTQIQGRLTSADGRALRPMP